MSILKHETSYAEQYKTLVKDIYARSIPANMQADVSTFVSTALLFLYRKNQKEDIILDEAFRPAITAYENILEQIATPYNAKSVRYAQYFMNTLAKKYPYISETFASVIASLKSRQLLEQAQEKEKFTELMTVQIEKIAANIAAKITEEKSEPQNIQHDLFNLFYTFLNSKERNNPFFSKDQVSAFATIVKFSKDKEFADIAELLNEFMGQCPGIFSEYQKAVERVRVQQIRPAPPPSAPTKKPLAAIPKPNVTAWIYADSPIFAQLQPDEPLRPELPKETTQRSFKDLTLL